MILKSDLKKSDFFAKLDDCMYNMCIVLFKCVNNMAHGWDNIRNRSSEPMNPKNDGWFFGTNKKLFGSKSTNNPKKDCWFLNDEVMNGATLGTINSARKIARQQARNPERNREITRRRIETFNDIKNVVNNKLDISDAEKPIFDNFHSDYAEIVEKINAFNFDNSSNLDGFQQIWNFLSKYYPGITITYPTLTSGANREAIIGVAKIAAREYLLKQEKYRELNRDKICSYIRNLEAWLIQNINNTDDSQQPSANIIWEKLGIVVNLHHDLGSLNFDINDSSKLAQIKQKFSNFGEADLKSLGHMIMDEYYEKWWNIPDVKYYGLAMAMGINIDSEDKLEIFKKTISTDDQTEYRKQVDERLAEEQNMMIEIHEEFVMPYLTERYRVAQELAETRKLYGDDYIKILSTQPNNSSTEIAVNLVQWNQAELKWYKLSKSEINEQEDATLKYTAFDMTFNNIFNANDPIVQRLINLKIDLRSELSNYWIYDPGNIFINQNARNRFVSEKLQNSWLTEDEINGLWEIIGRFAREVNKNYEILCENFYCDQKDFEKISKIYALGEIIENIKRLFSRVNTEKLGKHMGLELNKDNPADIIGDCLFLKWKFNWTEVSIKFDLNTGKLFMNSFVQQTFNPDKITIWNEIPDTEIWNLNSFENLLNDYNSVSVFQPVESENKTQDGYAPSNNNEEEWDSRKTTQKKLEWLTEKKLLDDLKLIWKIVGEKAWEKWMENSTISDLLKTFNILPDDWNKSIEFMWWSNLYKLLESIKNTDNERDLNDFSKLMWELMPFCGFEWWKNNIKMSNQVSIFDSEKSSDIIALQNASQNFFSNKWENIWTKDLYDSSTILPFVDIIIEKCCKHHPEWWKISISSANYFATPIINRIKKQEDARDLAGLEKLMDNAYSPYHT